MSIIQKRRTQWSHYLVLTYNIHFPTFVKTLKFMYYKSLCLKEVYRERDGKPNLCLRDDRNFWNNMELNTYLPEHRVSDAIQVHRAFIG